MEKAFGSSGSPASSSILNVSLALCPVARMRRSVDKYSSVPSELSLRPRSSPPRISRPSRRVRKRSSPPRASISRLMLTTTRESTSVPRWGLAS